MILMEPEVRAEAAEHDKFTIDCPSKTVRIGPNGGMGAGVDSAGAVCGCLGSPDH